MGPRRTPGSLLPLCGFRPAFGTWRCSLHLEGGGNRGWHHPAAPNREQVWSLCVLILGKWWGYSLPRREQTAVGMLIYKACPLKLTGLCKDLLHPALRRAIRAERDFATYVGRKWGVRGRRGAQRILMTDNNRGICAEILWAWRCL